MRCRRAHVWLIVAIAVPAGVPDPASAVMLPPEQALTGAFAEVESLEGAIVERVAEDAPVDPSLRHRLVAAYGRLGRTYDDIWSQESARSGDRWLAQDDYLVARVVVEANIAIQLAALESCDESEAHLLAALVLAGDEPGRRALTTAAQERYGRCTRDRLDLELRREKTGARASAMVRAAAARSSIASPSVELLPSLGGEEDAPSWPRWVALGGGSLALVSAATLIATAHADGGPTTSASSGAGGSDLSRELAQRRQTTRRVGWALAGLGVVAIASSVVLFVSDGDDRGQALPAEGSPFDVALAPDGALFQVRLF